MKQNIKNTFSIINGEIIYSNEDMRLGDMNIDCFTNSKIHSADNNNRLYAVPKDYITEKKIIKTIKELNEELKNQINMEFYYYRKLYNLP